MLVTYLLENLEGAGEHLRVLDDGKKLNVEGLEAARHVKTTLEGIPVPQGKGRLTLNLDADTSRYWQAFRVPPPGVNIEFFGYPGDLFLAYFGVPQLRTSAFEVQGWQTAVIQSISLEGALEDLGLGSVMPSAAFIEWEDGKVVLEVWDKRQLRNDVVENAEVGLLAIDDISEPDDIVLMGRSRILPEDKQSSPIMFHQTPVWRSLNDTVTVELTSGMHPNLLLNVKSEPPQSSCVLYANIKMPSAIFADQFQLVDLEAMSPPSEMLGIWGSTDLEAPVWLVNTGSEVLIRLDEPSNYSIPLHMRYEIPDYYGPRWLPAPQVFWACPDNVQHKPWAIETFFPQGTSFYPLRTHGLEFTIPTIDTASQSLVEKITGLVVVLGTIFVLLSLFKRVGNRQTTAEK